MKNRSLASDLLQVALRQVDWSLRRLLNNCYQKVDSAWTIPVIRFVMMIGTVTAAILSKPRLPLRKKGSIVEWTAFVELPYLFCLSAFSLFWGIYVECVIVQSKMVPQANLR
jgi:hypothetical protein